MSHLADWQVDTLYDCRDTAHTWAGWIHMLSAQGLFDFNR